MTQPPITSTQNPRIRQLTALVQKSSERRRQGLFVVEGQREVIRCISAGYAVDTIFRCQQLCTEPLPPGVTVIDVAPQLYERIAYRGGTEGLMAIVHQREQTLSMLTLPDNPLIVVLESVEKPGNLGAVLRSADAAGATAVVVCDPLTDLYNPNLIRASLGAFFTVPCLACGSQECISYLKSKGIAILTAQLQDSTPYYHTDMRRGVAIVMGTESTGLTQQWRQAADAHIRIPMLGRVDSLNVSVSAAILMYEAVRQRETPCVKNS